VAQVGWLGPKVGSHRASDSILDLERVINYCIVLYCIVLFLYLLCEPSELTMAYSATE